MIQENKELLLKDLCARLPYEVKGIVEDGINITTPFEWPVEKSIEFSMRYMVIKNGWRPYLFPLSSMTEEQKRELRQLDAFVSTFGQICFYTYDDYGHELMPTYEDAIRITNWLNKNHFDYRGLIPKGQAIDATGLNIY